MNAGIATATGNLIALLNDDAMADPGWLDAAAKALDESNIGAVTLARMRPESQPTSSQTIPMFWATVRCGMRPMLWMT